MRDWSLNIELSCNISETGSRNRDKKKFISPQFDEQQLHAHQKVKFTLIF